MNRAAARMGPTVCDELGPMPILNRSNVLTATAPMLPPTVSATGPVGGRGHGRVFYGPALAA